jgi:MFS family permease
LPWGRFHTLVVTALGITWILDGLEVTLAGSLAGALKTSLHFSNTDIGIASSAYLAGAVLGALFFGWLTDRLGRKKLFFVTLSVYLVATAATAASWSLESFALVSDRRRDRGRIRRNQFDDSGACSGAGAWLDRSRDQRNLLDWRGLGRARFARIA